MSEKIFKVFLTIPKRQFNNKNQESLTVNPGSIHYFRKFKLAFSIMPPAFKKSLKNEGEPKMSLADNIKPKKADKTLQGRKIRILFFLLNFGNLLGF